MLAGLALLLAAGCTTDPTPPPATAIPTVVVPATSTAPVLPPPPRPTAGADTATPAPPLPPSSTLAPAETETPGLAETPPASETPVPTRTAEPQETATPEPSSTRAAAPAPTHTRPPATVAARPSSTRTAAHRYVFPVEPISAVISYGPYHHDYPATDIFCPVGSHFVAPTGGRVDYVSYKDSWDPQVDDPATRGGLSVALIGDDGVRYYGSHLSAVAPGIAPGVRVAVGQILGLTGKTGDARLTDPHLHFGISHPTRPDDWAVRRGEISPYPYLRAWAAGTPRTPILP